MTKEEAIKYLRNYPCVCKYGLSPYACKDKEGCEFSIAVRTLCEDFETDEMLAKNGIHLMWQNKGEWVEYQEDNEIMYYCSICKVTKGQAVNNFCACCGADMRGKGE